VPRIVISLGRRYMRYVNRTCLRTGTLWYSREKSSVVDSDRYLLICQLWARMPQSR